MDNADSKIVLVQTTFPNAEAARRVAEALVRGGLAACVQLGAEVESMYFWQGEFCAEREIPCSIKTDSAALEKLCKRLRELHPYECPQILWGEASASSDYAQWARQCCAESRRRENPPE